MSENHYPDANDSDLNALRMECLVILERCLTDHDLGPFVRFVESQVSREEPPVSVLRMLTDDLVDRLEACNAAQQRLIADSAGRIMELSGYDAAPWFSAINADRAVIGLTRVLLPRISQSMAQLSTEDQRLLIDYLHQRQAEGRALIRRRQTLREAYALVDEWSSALGIVSAQRRWHAHGREHFVQNIRH